MNPTNSYSIKDKPIGKKDEDKLKMLRYINALSSFILNSDTPITIGLQGEWGTGKTSMMYLLKELLDGKNVATSWINTWEYSMFRGVKETTPAIMKGLLENLQESTSGENGKAAEFWNKGDVKNTAIKVGRFFLKIANNVIANQTGLNISDALPVNNQENVENRAEIAEIKNDISGIINKLINDDKNPYKRVVFFVDDLDRINPVDAVEVLESLKNIFDLEHCIFVLAIDYDVVIKGLEGKFGKKTEANEREFRSFFDKIIQVPFSMPTGAYDIDSFLKEKLINLGIKDSDKLSETYMSVVKNSVGYNPRSLKRFLNTFSLINIIRSEEHENQDGLVKQDVLTGDSGNSELMLFSLLGIQISYPIIFRYLSIDPNYTEWDKAFAVKHGLDWTKVLEKIKEFGETELTNEDWEKVVWGFCQQDSYMKNRAMSVLELLNVMRSTFGDDLSNTLLEAMEFAAITSVDDNQESRQAMSKVGNKFLFNDVGAKAKELEKLNLNKAGIKLWVDIWTLVEGLLKNHVYTINYAKTTTTLYIGNEKPGWILNPSKNSPGMRLVFAFGNENNQIDFKNFISGFSLQNNPNIIVHPGWLDIRPGLCKDLKIDEYTKFMMDSMKKIVGYYTS